jgi:GT2 family glycosyltransferase
MKVCILLLDYMRHDFTQQVKDVNLNNSYYPFSLITIDRKGIAAALNEGIEKARGHDAIVTMANDILMPPAWLALMVRAAEAIPNTGMCGIHTVEGIEPAEIVNGVVIHKSYTAFGNVLIPFKAIEKVGGFNTEYDPYGMQDADYAHRLLKTGHINYYLHDMRAEHIGHDVGNGTEYRKMKDDGLNLAGEKWNRLTKLYDETENYIIDMKQAEGE